MKRLFFIVFFIPLLSIAQTHRWGTLVNYNTGGQHANIAIYAPLDTSTPKPVYIFIPGNGESNTDTNGIYVNGPFVSVKNGTWNRDAWVVCIQPPSANPGYSYIKLFVNALLRGPNPLIHADSNRFYPTGLSYGCAGWYNYIENVGLTNFGAVRPAAAILMSYENTSNTTIESYWVNNAPIWGFAATDDAPHGTGMISWFTSLFNNYPNTNKQLSKYTGGHCCWNTFYNTSNNTIVAQNGAGITVYTGSIYNWAEQFSNGPPPSSPINANAGSDRTILTIGTQIGNSSSDTNTTSQTYLNGTLSTPGTGSFTGITWTKLSGPTGAKDTIYKSSTLQPIVARFNISGTYTYKLTVTSSSGTDTDTVVVTASKNPIVITPANGLTIKQVGASEYLTNYLASDGQVYRRTFNGSARMIGNYNMMGPVKRIAGGQYWGSMVDSLGYAFLLKNDVFYNAAEWIPYDSTGKLFDSITYSQSYISTDFFLQNGKLYVYGQDRFGWYGVLGTPITKPLAVAMPSGKIYSKIDVGEGGVIGLATDGTIWIHPSGITGGIPVQRTVPRAAIDVLEIRKGTFIAIVPDAGQPTTSGWPYVWGLTDYAGGTGTSNIPTDYRTVWNITSPIAKIFSSDESPTMIDINGKMWSMGFDGQGEVGDGYELVNKLELYKPPYASDWATGPIRKRMAPISDSLLSGRTFVTGWGGNAFGFYKYALGADGNMYSWGRNKSFDAGDGRSMSDGGAQYPNGLDILKPTLVNPLYASVDQRVFIVGIVNAGSDQSVTTNSITLTGHTKATTFYTQQSVSWRDISGLSSIFTRNDSIGTVTNMANGIHKFVLRMVDNNTGSIEDTVQIIVNAGTPPTVVAGPNQTIVFPVNTVNLSGTVTPIGGTTVTNITWIGTGTGYVITSPNTVNTDITGLAIGSYIFTLNATDNNGNIGSSSLLIVVQASATYFLKFNRGTLLGH